MHTHTHTHTDFPRYLSTCSAALHAILHTCLTKRTFCTAVQACASKSLHLSKKTCCGQNTFCNFDQSGWRHELEIHYNPLFLAMSILQWNNLKIYLWPQWASSWSSRWTFSTAWCCIAVCLNWKIEWFVCFFGRNLGACPSLRRSACALLAQACYWQTEPHSGGG